MSLKLWCLCFWLYVVRACLVLFFTKLLNCPTLFYRCFDFTVNYLSIKFSSDTSPRNNYWQTFLKRVENFIDNSVRPAYSKEVILWNIDGMSREFGNFPIVENWWNLLSFVINNRCIHDEKINWSIKKGMARACPFFRPIFTFRI